MSERHIICSTCRIQFPDIDPYKLHLTTEFHTYNMKRKMAGLDPITEEIFHQKKSTLLAAAGNTQNHSQMTDNMWKCEPCKKIFKSNEQLQQHKQAKQHKKNEKIFIENNPDTSQSSMFKSFQVESKNTNLISVGNLLTMLKTNENENGQESSHPPSSIAQSINDQESIQEEKDEDKIPIATSLDNLRICLFCNKESEGIKKNLDHMMLAHSFFVPDVDCIINLKGLLGYIAERVHLGFLCLYCSKQFTNGRSCQQHMMDKGHCFLNQDDEEEFEEFYDFSKTYENHPLAIKTTKRVRKEGEDGVEDGKGEEAWEDVDFESADEEEVEVDEEEKKDDATTALKTDDSEQIDTTTTKTEDGKTEEKAGKQFKQKLGKTREEALLGLNIKPAEQLETGELKLGSGRIIGTRELKYIYKQKFRMPDNREAVLINKLAMEYRKIRSIAIEGTTSQINHHAALQVYNGMTRQNKMDLDHVKAFTRKSKRENYMTLKMGLTGNNLQYYFRKRE